MKSSNHLVKSEINRYLITLMMLLFSTSCFSYTFKHSASANSPESIQNYYYNQEYKKVIVHGNQFLKLYPKDTDILLYVGLAYYKQKNYQKAITTFTAIVNLSTKYKTVWPLLAQSYINLKQYPQALNVVKNGLKFYPKNKKLLKKKAYLENITTAKKETGQSTQQVAKEKTSIKKVVATTISTEKSIPQKPSKPTTIAHKSTAQKTTTPKKPVTKTLPKSQAITYQDILGCYKSKQYSKSIALAKTYLVKYPDDTDVRNLLGLSYMKQKKHVNAERQFRLILSKNKNNTNARKRLIDTLFAQEKYHEIIIETNQGITDDSHKNEWLYEQAKAYYMLDNYKSSIKSLEKISDLDKDLEAKKLYDAINEETHYRYLAHNEFGLYNSQIQVRKPNEPWNLTTLYGLRKNDYGAFGGFVKYQHRPNETGYQWGLTAQPLITKTTYLDLAYAYSDEPALFANDFVYAEGYQYLPWALRASLGDGYRKIEQTYLNAYTGSVAKFIDNYEIGVRPTHFVPKEGPESTLYKAYITRYGVTNPDRQITLTYADGQSPDLADLQTVNFFKVDDTFYMLSGQEPVNKRLLFQYGLGYERQRFPNGRIRRYYYIDIGAKFKAV